MNPRIASLFCIGLFLLAGCGPSRAELDATATQAVANTFATLTAQAPTATATFTPSPTPTATPSSTPTITPTPTPRVMAAVLTLEDLPAGFEAMPAEDLASMGQGLPDDATAFGFGDELLANFVMGFLIPWSSPSEQAAYDAALPQFVELFAAAVGGSTPSETSGLEDIGEARAAGTSVSNFGALSICWDIVAFRRGDIGAILIVGHPEGEGPAAAAIDLAGLIDQRISDLPPASP